MSADFAAYVRALPKVELHLHLLGSASPETVVGLAARHPESPVPADLDQLRDYYEVCPTSNLRTRAVADLAAHPVTGMLAAGLLVTVNTDDPPMFGADLTSEYLNIARIAGLDRAAIAALAANGIRASFLDAAAKAVLMSELEKAAEPTRSGR